MSNVYYNPEKWGLTVVAQIDYSSGSYEFDYRVVWRDEEGNFFTARSAGCSCPMPFEEFASKAELERCTAESLIAEVNGDHYYADLSERRKFIQTVLDAMR